MTIHELITALLELPMDNQLYVRIDDNLCKTILEQFDYDPEPPLHVDLPIEYIGWLDHVTAITLNPDEVNTNVRS